MNSAQQERVNQLFETCRDLPQAERVILLNSSAETRVVEDEVWALLEAYDRSAGFLEEPVLAQQAAVLEEALRPYAEIAPGTQFGHFEIIELLGAGGMGMVYRAHDTILHRDVALKMLPPEFAEDPVRRVRFQTEARAVAALNHPNIASLYAVEKGALVMELVSGRSLAERIRSGPVPVNEALGIAGQIADGLEAAHERGIVHGDLKPANIQLTPEGVIKVLDFGLARATGGTSSERRPGTAASFSTLMSDIGPVFGTAGYMAPEQAASKPVDKRADIWSFGVVLYEMLVGSPPFTGETPSHTLAGVLTAEPDLQQVPDNLRPLLQLCLEKDPKRRLRDIGDWRKVLQAVPIKDAESNPRGSMLPWIIAIAAVMALGITWALRLEDAKAPAFEIRADIAIPASEEGSSFALSPDGRKLVFTAFDKGQRRLWVRTLDSTSAQLLPGTEGAINPFWSPDARSLGFFADYKLKRLDLGAAQPQTLAPVASNSPQGTWGMDGTILFTASGLTPLSRVPAAGGQATVAIKLPGGQTNQLAPRFLAGTRRFLFVVNGADPSIWLASLDNEVPRRITGFTLGTDSAAEFLPPSLLVRVRHNVLEAQHFNVELGRLTGEPMPLDRSVGADPLTLAGWFSASASGTIAWRGGRESRRQLIWFNRSGENLGSLGEIGDVTVFSPEIAPDGKRVATMRGPIGGSDIWVQEGGRNSRLTLHPADDRYPIWSPDGTRVAFASNRGGTYDLYEKAANASGNEQLLLQTPEFKRPNSWSPDGRFILYWSAQNNGDLMLLPLTGDRKPIPFVSTPFDEQQGVFSPDGKWVAYQSDESGRFEVYVRPFPGPGGRSQVSTGGGHSPRWRADCKGLYYLDPDLRLMATRVETLGGTFIAGTPEALFQTHINTATNRQQYDVAPDGRFLILTDLPDMSTEPIHLLLNWKPASR